MEPEVSPMICPEIMKFSKYCIAGCGKRAFWGPDKNHPLYCTRDKRKTDIKTDARTFCQGSSDCISRPTYGLRGDILTRCRECFDRDVDILIAQKSVLRKREVNFVINAF